MPRWPIPGFDASPDLFGPRERVLRVAELTHRIRATLEEEFGDLWVEGEVSNFRRPESGHWYFTLKDAQAQIAAVMFRGDQAGVAVRLADGLQVQAYGRVTVYEPRGQYQLVLRRIRSAGRGALLEAMERLKAKLQAEGLFETARKRPLPVLPRHIGIATSPTGAAIRDLLNVLTRRFPNLHIVVAPCRVQGDGAAAEIAAALDLLSARPEIELVICGRGGGSLEDLWAFNEEVVARAIARARVPVISAVGHETDFTIADFVADLRAPTPSAAAELAIGEKAVFEEGLALCGRRMRRAAEVAVDVRRARLRAASESHVFRTPGHLARQYRERLVGRTAAMAHALTGRVRQAQQFLDEFHLRAGHAAARWTEAAKHRLAGRGAQLRALSPLAVLDRGYSLTRLADGTLVRRVAQAPGGIRLRTQVSDGSFESVVAND